MRPWPFAAVFLRHSQFFSANGAKSRPRQISDDINKKNTLVIFYSKTLSLSLLKQIICLN
jgi:hypothetical protein